MCEVLDQMCFWNAIDLTRTLEMLRLYYNEQRVHRSLAGTTPANMPAHPRRPLSNSIISVGDGIASDYFRFP